MADPSRQPFRFRLPWMINPLSNLTNQRATQPTATIPVQRTIRAPTVPLPPQPQPPPPPKTEPKPPSPTRSGPQSGMVSQPQSQSRAASQPPSPSRTAPPSPSRTAPPTQVASLPPSPPQTTPSQPQATQKTESQPPSPSRAISQTPLPSQTTPSPSQTPPRMESRTAPSSQVSPRTTPQPQASSEPQSPSRPTPSQSQASPKMESKPAPPSPSAPRTTPQSKSTSEPPSPSRTTPSQSLAPPKTESKPPPPSPAALQSGMSSQPPSPSRASKTQSATRTVSQPPSPSPTNTQVLPASRVPSKPSSPTRLASQAANRTSPQSPSSSSRTTPKVATIQTTSQPPSPSRQVSRLQTKTQASTNPSSPPKSSVSKTEPSSDKTTKAEPTIFHPLSQDPQSQAPAPQSQNQIKLQAASAQAEDKRQPSQVLGPAVVMPTSTTTPPEIPATQPLKSSVVPIDPKKHQNLEAETKETKEEKPKLESSRKEDKPMIVVNEEPKQRKSTDFFNIATGSNKQPQGRFSTTSQGKHNHLNKQVHGDDKDMAQESKTTTTTHPKKDMNASSESQPQPPVSQGEQATLHKEIKESIFGVIHKLGTGHTTQGMDGPVSVITLTGENRGASMHVGAELARKEGSVHINRGYMLNQDDKNEMTTDGESSSKRKSSNPIPKEEEASTAYINSNIQSINNSIMSNSSISERSPGVRWVFEHNQIEPVKNGNQKSVEAHKADFNVTHSQKLTYEPTVRRRCLRGLLLEPSDSDPDNPEKPRRHGCRYSCDEKKKCKDNGKEGTAIQF